MNGWRSSNVAWFLWVAALAAAGRAWGQGAVPRRPYRGIPLSVEWIPDVVYRTIGETELALDVYRPRDAKTSRPVVVMVHGGGWTGGDKKGFQREAGALATRGYAAVSINYRLLPEAEGLDMLDDVQCAVRWVRKNAAQYDFDPARVGLVGGSAGAHLASLAAVRPERPCPEPALADWAATVSCVAEFFGPTDLRAAALQPVFRSRFANAIEKDPEFPAEFSPVAHVSSKAPPFLILHGDADRVVPVAQAEALKEALERAGVEVQMICYPKAPHGFIHYVGPKSRPSGASWPYLEAWQATYDFFAKHLDPQK